MVTVYAATVTVHPVIVYAVTVHTVTAYAVAVTVHAAIAVANFFSKLDGRAQMEEDE